MSLNDSILTKYNDKMKQLNDLGDFTNPSFLIAMNSGLDIINDFRFSNDLSKYLIKVNQYLDYLSLVIKTSLDIISNAVPNGLESNCLGKLKKDNINLEYKLSRLENILSNFTSQKSLSLDNSISKKLDEIRKDHNNSRENLESFEMKNSKKI